MRVCQFRHDGNLDLQCSGGQEAAVQEDLHFYFTGRLRPVKPPLRLRMPKPSYPSFAVIEIFAFNTFDTGQPFSAASAYF